ncbi:MAG: type II secretion system F family protein, partial [Nocardioidaceae bacterium]
GTLESVRARRRRERIERDLPMALDLTVAALGAGRPPAQALDLVGSAIGGPLAEDLAAITARLDLGADPLQVWRRAAEQPGLRPLGRAFARATQTGASVTVVLARGVDDLRSERRAEAQRVARAAGVRTAAPLGACFLPAFVVVGIVPTLVSVFERFVL